MDSISLQATRDRHRAEVASWKTIVAPFEKPSAGRGVWQTASTLAAYAATWALMALLQPVSWWLTIPLVVLAGGLLARVFIIFHDCCHNSLLPSARANRVLGFFTGVLVFTSFRHWRWEHSLHHASAGDLDRRGVGDVWTMTVEEFLAAPWWKRLLYRVMRNPVVLLGICPLLLFLVRERLSSRGASATARHSVWLTNLGLAVMITAGCLLFGVAPFLILQFAVLAVTSTTAVWMFYVQHQFEGVYWERHQDWEYTSAALLGSSFYKLPRILQWFSGNIGYHHVHHLSSKIPNYHLERCHRAHELFSKASVLTLKTSLRCLRFRLWDESNKRLVGFRQARLARLARQAAAAASPAGA